MLIVLLVTMVLLIILVPRLWRAQMSGNEASAMVSLHAIHRAQYAYAVGFGYGFFATSLTNLATGPGGSAVGFINPDLGSADVVEKRGYRVTITPGMVDPASPSSCNDLPAGSIARTYAATASSVVNTSAFSRRRSASVRERGQLDTPVLAS